MANVDSPCYYIHVSFARLKSRANHIKGVARVPTEREREREREREGILKRWFYNKLPSERHKQLSTLQIIAYIQILFGKKLYNEASKITFKCRWLRRGANGDRYFDIKGAKLPLVNKEYFGPLADAIFGDTFLISAFYKDCYEKSLVERVEPILSDGVYGYTDLPFDVTVKENDVVIDAGAWIGDFAAYAASKNALCYAFEPTSETYDILCKTAELNDNKIIPIKKGLSDIAGERKFSINIDGIGNQITQDEQTAGETIQITTLDQFVKERKLERVDFIKADIEGAERDMLKGARNTLAKFAPKLAICTYHLPDDPIILEQLILEANPKYTIVQLRKKLFACVLPT
ncbi:MAG: FkbM family methyltransferase [Helicobacteraceae bacterium]|jgi:FkbM family methyltransferase|nr:FkbM family methyltransferase [Helicobacteraceae bacterium]